MVFKMSVLEVKNLIKTISGKTILDGVQFKIYKEELFGLLGPHGETSSHLKARDV